MICGLAAPPRRFAVLYSVLSACSVVLHERDFPHAKTLRRKARKGERDSTLLLNLSVLSGLSEAGVSYSSLSHAKTQRRKGRKGRKGGSFELRNTRKARKDGGRYANPEQDAPGTLPQGFGLSPPPHRLLRDDLDPVVLKERVERNQRKLQCLGLRDDNSIKRIRMVVGQRNGFEKHIRRDREFC